MLQMAQKSTVGIKIREKKEHQFPLGGKKYSRVEQKSEKTGRKKNINGNKKISRLPDRLYEDKKKKDGAGSHLN